MSEDRALFGIVCDDVRQEIGNKISLMGVYSSSIIVPGFPIVLPRLAFVMRARTLASNPFRSLRFLVRRDSEKFLESEPSMEPAPVAIPSFAEHSRDKDPASVYVETVAVLTLAGMQFDGPCTLSMHAITESEELRCGTIQLLARDLNP